MEKNYFSKNDIITYGRYNVLTRVYFTARKLHYAFPVDYLIAPILEELDKKGYKTKYSCSGHWDKQPYQTYIYFMYDYGFENLPKGFNLKKEDDGCIIEAKIHSQQSTNVVISALTSSLNNLYEWAVSLPNYEKQNEEEK